MILIFVFFISLFTQGSVCAAAAIDDSQTLYIAVGSNAKDGFLSIGNRENCHSPWQDRADRWQYNFITLTPENSNMPVYRNSYTYPKNPDDIKKCPLSKHNLRMFGITPLMLTINYHLNTHRYSFHFNLKESSTFQSNEIDVLLRLGADPLLKVAHFQEHTESNWEYIKKELDIFEYIQSLFLRNENCHLQEILVNLYFHIALTLFDLRPDLNIETQRRILEFAYLQPRKKPFTIPARALAKLKELESQ